MNERGLLTIRMVARDWLRKSERGLWRDIASGTFGPELIRLGRSVRVRVSELDEWIQAGCPTREEWEAQREARR
jgi:predicted DNA-binding transcriptional regulator AlpA